MVGSRSPENLIGKSCQRKGVLTADVTSDSYTAIEKVIGERHDRLKGCLN